MACFSVVAVFTDSCRTSVYVNVKFSDCFIGLIIDAPRLGIESQEEYW